MTTIEHAGPSDLCTQCGDLADFDRSGQLCTRCGDLFDSLGEDEDEDEGGPVVDYHICRNDLPDFIKALIESSDWTPCISYYGWLRLKRPLTPEELADADPYIYAMDSDTIARAGEADSLYNAEMRLGA